MKKIIPLSLAAILLSTSIANAISLKELFEQGLSALSQEKYDEAIKLFEKTIEIKPDLAPAYNYLGLAYKEKAEDNQKVIAAFRKSIELNPKYASPYENLGKLYYGMGEMDKAEEYCLKAVKLQPDLVSANLALGWIYLIGKSDPYKAIHYFSKVIDDNNLPFSFYGLGIAYFQAGQYPMTLDMITSLRKVNRNDLAEHLEHMVRDGHYVPPRGGMPLSMPQRQQSTLVSDEANSYTNNTNKASNSQKPTASNIGNTPVHLKGKWSENSGSQPQEPQGPTQTGEERLRELQRNSMRNGSGY